MENTDNVPYYVSYILIITQMETRNWIERLGNYDVTSFQNPEQLVTRSNRYQTTEKEFF